MPTKISKDRIEAAMLTWQARHKERMSYVELAERAGVNVMTLHRIKSGDVKQIDLDKLHKIAKVLECDPSDLFFTTWTDKDQISAMPPEVIDRKRENLKFEDEYKAAKGIDQQNTQNIRMAVAKFKGWILRSDRNKPEIEILKPGASSISPAPDDIRLLAGAYAEEWKNQNPSEVASKR